MRSCWFGFLVCQKWYLHQTLFQIFADYAGTISEFLQRRASRFSALRRTGQPPQRHRTQGNKPAPNQSGMEHRSVSLVVGESRLIEMKQTLTYRRLRISVLHSELHKPRSNVWHSLRLNLFCYLILYFIQNLYRKQKKYKICQTGRTDS